MVVNTMPERHLVREEIRTRHSPPDHPLVALSFACFAGAFSIMPAFFPDPEGWRSRIWYIKLVLGSIVTLMGIWAIVMFVLMAVDRIVKRPSFPSEQVMYRRWYYILKYLMIGSLVFCVSLSGIFSVYWFLKGNDIAAVFFFGLIVYRAISALFRFREELKELYGNYRRITRGANIWLPRLGMIIFSALVVVDKQTGILISSTLLVFLLQVWMAWYLVKLSVLNIMRSALHLGLVKGVAI